MVDQQQLLGMQELKPYLFQIYHNQERVCTIPIKVHLTVGDLLTAVKQFLADKYGKIIALASVCKFEVFDYVLTQKTYPICLLQRQPNELKIVLKKPVNQATLTLLDFNFLKCLGQGGSSVVFLVRHCGNGLLYALKQVNKDFFQDYKRLEQILRQRRIMIQIIKQFPFSSQLIASFQSQHHLNMLLEYYPGGQIFYHLQRERLSEDETKLYIAQTIICIQYLHEKKIIYRDLKPQNIMIDFDGHARLSDYGLCKLNLTKNERTISYCGSSQYMAPEIKNNNGYSYSVDFYALGTLIYEFVVGVPPFYQKAPLSFPVHVSQQFIDLVCQLIEIDVTKRMNSFYEIKKCAWLKQIDWNKIIRREYQMPYKVSPYSCYIHQEFKSILREPISRVREEKYDHLLKGFYFVRETSDSPFFCYKIKMKQLKNKAQGKKIISKSKSKKSSLNKQSLRSNKEINMMCSKVVSLENQLLNGETKSKSATKTFFQNTNVNKIIRSQRIVPNEYEMMNHQLKRQKISQKIFKNEDIKMHLIVKAERQSNKIALNKKKNREHTNSPTNNFYFTKSKTQQHYNSNKIKVKH